MSFRFMLHAPNLRHPFAISAAIVVGLLAPLNAAEPKDDRVFKAGLAERDITPDLGMEQPGGYGKAFHTKLHDPCKVRAVVFDDGTTRVALVGLDALLLHRPTVLAARKRIEQRCGIPGANVLISASHSHSSGPTGMVLPGQFDDAEPFVKELAYEKSSCANPEYLQRVEDQIVDAVCAANEARVNAKAGVGKGIEDKVAFNRRFRMRNGLTMTHPRQGNPDMLDVAGPTDPEVGVIGVWDESGKFLGCVVNYACHATAGPGGISANYIYYLEQVVRGAMGSDAVVVFLPGACGDITQVNNLDPEVPRKPEPSSRFVGGRIGAEAVKVLLTMEAGKLLPLTSKSTLLEMGHRVPKPERVERCRKIAASDSASADRTEWTFAKEIVLLDYLLKTKKTTEVEVQAVQVGPAVFVSNPAEYFCQYGLDVKAGSPFAFTFPVELADGCVGYVPTEEALGPRGGGYETRLTFYSHLEPAAGRKIADAGIALTKTLTPGVEPRRPAAPPYKGGAWGYGSVPPEVD